MIPFERSRQQTIPHSSVKIVGVGGAGANMLDRIALDGMDGAELLAINTDVRTLASSVAAEKIQLGRNLTMGLGTGGDPALGRRAAEEAELEIRDALRDRKIVFICAGLGGGTGSGAAPLVARLAREQGAFTVVFATMPFAFEGERRKEQADNALTEVSAISNALVTFDNSRMGELVLAKQGVHEAFGAADRMISESIKAVTRIVMRPGLVNIGLDDLVSALSSNKSRCLFGSGIAEGENRAQKALKNALVSPLLDRGSLLNDATAVLVHICGGEDLTLYEIELLMRGLSKHIPDSAQLLFGTAVDPAMGESLSVTLVSSLPEEKLLNGRASEQEIAPPPKKKTLENDASGDGVDTSAIDEKADEADSESTVAQLAEAAAPVTARAVDAPPAPVDSKAPKVAVPIFAPQAEEPPAAQPASDDGTAAAEAAASSAEPSATREEPVASEEAGAIEAQAPSEEQVTDEAPESPEADVAPPTPKPFASKLGMGRLKGAVPAAPFRKLKMKTRELDPQPVKSPAAVAASEGAAKSKAPSATAKAEKGRGEEPAAEEANGATPEEANSPAVAAPPSRPPLPEMATKIKPLPDSADDFGDLDDLDDMDASGVEGGQVDLRTRRVKLPPKRQGSTIREVRDVYEDAEDAPGEEARKAAHLPPAPVAMTPPGAQRHEPAAPTAVLMRKGGAAPQGEDDANGVAFETIEPREGQAAGVRTSIEELQAAAEFDPKSQTELALEGGPKGRFEGEEPNLVDGEDLDVPPFLRKQK